MGMSGDSRLKWEQEVISSLDCTRSSLFS